MDPSVYPDPLRFRPARYLGKADAKQETQGYAGWGSGLHVVTISTTTAINIVEC
jgi:cytochrome P450